MTFRRTRCPSCKGKLEAGQRIHSECINAYAEDQAAKAERARAKAERMAAKVERAEYRKRKEEMRPRQYWLKKAETACNAYIRERDKHLPCICCGKWSSDKDLLTGSRWDAGHYRSVGSAQHLRYDERNIHRQLVYCNKHRAGNHVEYRIGLVARIGLEAVEALEADQSSPKWTIEDLKAITAMYRGKLKLIKETA